MSVLLTDSVTRFVPLRVEYHVSVDDLVGEQQAEVTAASWAGQDVLDRLTDGELALIEAQIWGEEELDRG